ncbi:MAG: oxidoreductase [Promethearchaeota archaeon]|jgi:2,4-dienoyl-CoA reductase-like NADH-dependent reductase (Old Yellow Enzyme family)
MPKLSDPITIRGMTAKNRLGYPPMLSFSADGKGCPSPRTYNIHRLKAQGGVGLITFEATGLERQTGFGSPSIGRDENIPEYKKLTDMVHSHGAKIGMQLASATIIGFVFARFLFNVDPGVGPFGPSKVDLAKATDVATLYDPAWPETVKKGNYEMQAFSKEQILTIQDQFAEGARRAIEAGFDYIDIHSGHGTTLASFLSPWLNKRTDEYGGSIENRCRFHTETMQKMREKIGEDHPIFIRFSADELLPDGNRIEDGIKIAKTLEKGGADVLDVTQGVIYRSPSGIQIPSYCKHGCFIRLPDAIRKEVNIPVIGVGRIIDPAMADQFIQEGRADIIYMGRQLICDPETPNKYFSGRSDEIRHCMGCLQNCGQNCIQEAYGAQNYQELTTSTNPKKIIVLGAGIAGLEAARVSKLRGHEVEIYEKTDKVGGLMPLIAAEYGKADFINSVTYAESQLKKLGVPIYLNKELDRDEIAKLKPDILVIATGSEATIPVNLKDKPNIVTQDESILKTKEMGNNIVVWGLNAYWRGGIESAISLIEEGYNVKAIVGPEKAVAGLLRTNLGRGYWILNYLKKRKIPIYKNAKLLDVSKNEVKFLDENEEEQSIEADTLVYCGSRITHGKRLSEEFKGVAPEIVLIGDGKQPRDIEVAIKEAQAFARNLE